MMLSKPVKITVCADGHVSIMRNAKDRRLNAALPCYSVDDVPQALMLIQKVCILKACEHGGKTGTLVEAYAPSWPLGGAQDVEPIYQLAKLFEEADYHE